MQVNKYALERVLRLNFYHQQETDISITQALSLLQEHLRLIWHWATFLGISNHWPSLIFSGLTPWVTEGIEVDEDTKKLLYSIKFPTLLVRQTLNNYLLWSAIEQHPTVKDSKLTSPYEPLIRVYEGNGFVYLDNGILMIVASDGQTSISQNSEFYERSEPFVRL